MDLHKLQVEITAEIKKFKAKCDEVKTESAKTMNEANKQFAKIGDDNKFASKLTKQMDNARKQTESTIKKIQSIAKQSKIDAGLIEPTKAYKTLTKDIQAAEKELERLQAKQNSMSDKDRKTETDKYRRIAEKAASYRKENERLRAEMRELEQFGSVGTNNDKYKALDEQWKNINTKMHFAESSLRKMENDGSRFAPTEKWQALQREITAAKEKLLGYRAQESQMASGGKDYTPTKNYSGGKAVLAQAKGFGSAGAKEIGKTLVELGKMHPALAKAMSLARSFGNTAKKAFKGGSSAAKVLSAPLKASTGFLKILGSGFGSVLTKLKGLIPVLNRTNRSMNSMYGSGSRLGRMWQTLKMTAGFMAASFVIMGSANSAKEGFKNLSQYSEQTNSDLSMLMSSLTQLKNSFATAFAPILTVVAPILNTLIGYVTSAITAVGHFFGALTGQSTVTVAKQVTQDFASSVAETGSAASDANEEAESLKRTLMGFDQINKLDSTDSSSSSGSTGTTLSPSEMFTTEEVSGVASGWAQKIKDAWANADFTEIGTILGEKLNGALNSINWTKINATLSKIASSVATFLNGFISGTDWTLVGSTFANGINTMVNAGYTFVTTFNWNQFGTAISNAINGFIEDLDLSRAGQTFSTGIKGILSTINTALTETDWNAIGQKVGTFLTNVDWVGILKSVGLAIVNAIIGVLDFADGLFTSICDGLKELNWSKVVKDVWDLIKASWGLVGKVLNVGISLVKNGWSVLKSWLGIKDKGMDQKINRKKGWVDTIREFLGLSKSSKDSKNQKIGRSRGWSGSIRSFLGLTDRNKSMEQRLKLKKDGWSGIKSWLGIENPFSLKFKLPRIRLTWKEGEYKGFKISYPALETYATGGFPEEGPFMMNRGEIAGRFSNGKSVVANNQQITTGIANAVGPAVYDAVLSALMQGGGNNGNVTIVLEGDARGLFKAVKQEADSYTRSTGQSAFSF